MPNTALTTAPTTYKDVLSTLGAEVTARQQQLINRQKSLRRRIKIINTVRSFFVVLAIFFASATIIFLFYSRIHNFLETYAPPTGVLVGITIVLTAISLAFSPASRQQELIDISDEIDFISRRALSSTEAKVNSLLKNWDNPRLGLYKSHQDELRRFSPGYGRPWRGWQLCKAPFLHSCSRSSISGFRKDIFRL